MWKRSIQLVGGRLLCQSANSANLGHLQMLESTAGLHLPPIECFLKIIDALLACDITRHKAHIVIELPRGDFQNYCPPWCFVVDDREGLPSTTPAMCCLEVQRVREVIGIPPNCVWELWAPHIIESMDRAIWWRVALDGCSTPSGAILCC